jgi:hypothetical protein
VTGEVSLALLAGLLLPALGFLRHCLLSPPSSWADCEDVPAIVLVAAAWHAHTMATSFAAGHLPGLRESEIRNCRASSLTRDGLSAPPSYQM